MIALDAGCRALINIIDKNIEPRIRCTWLRVSANASRINVRSIGRHPRVICPPSFIDSRGRILSPASQLSLTDIVGEIEH